MTSEAKTGSVLNSKLAGEAPRWYNRLPLHATLVIVALVWLLPTVALLVSSFRPENQILTNGWWNAFSFPLDFTIDNYQEVLSKNNMGTSFLNSLFIAIPATVIPIMVAAFAAYAFAWMDFPGRNLLFILVVGLLVVPLQSTLIPVLQFTTSIGLTGTFAAVWLAHAGFGLPFAIFLLRNFFMGIPSELLDSARVDGAGHATIFARIILPLALPGIASLAIFQFLWTWNDLLIALVFARPVNAPLTAAILQQTRNFGQNVDVIAPGAFLQMLVPLIVFFAFQRYFVRGIMGGSVKG